MNRRANFHPFYSPSVALCKAILDSKRDNPSLILSRDTACPSLFLSICPSKTSKCTSMLIWSRSGVDKLLRFSSLSLRSGGEAMLLLWDDCQPLARLGVSGSSRDIYYILHSSNKVQQTCGVQRMFEYLRAISGGCTS